jgi:hypothetical protein
MTARFLEAAGSMVSGAMSLPKSAGEPAFIVPPWSASRAISLAQLSQLAPRFWNFVGES